ncbi:acetyl-CoA carboxylase biotin carboxyl carrier protein [Sphingomonas hankyongi]|uniref:Biotin carboxyl carrier protein of acetyl-CoA carboxylase n=1 Tax=Sphingomonas hankyongi TaxID=2908209 RepID=A0ABT0RZS7_9SPHN|nr:acetyl-CoA carboxylase biotin carboxyl carrier protein [Sphingomonas hankyongi]MCL6729097.1 acetyl-CoA carboxylase biotin carboxyl carrier protein [Sphingomonas hankyongi]
MAQPPKGAKIGDMRIDPTLVRELAQLLTDNELTEIEVEDGDRRIKVKREPAALIAAPSAAPALAAAPALTGPPAHAKEDLGAPVAEEDAGGTSIKSPMVGTAYLSPQPGAAQFVSVGDTVKAGDTLLIVEAMKVMNPITAPEGGVVKKLLVSDGQPVEFDQPLAVIG